MACRMSLMTADLLLIHATWANLYRQGTPLWCVLEMNGFIAVLLRDGMDMIHEFAAIVLTVPA